MPRLCKIAHSCTGSHSYRFLLNDLLFWCLFARDKFKRRIWNLHKMHNARWCLKLNVSSIHLSSNYSKISNCDSLSKTEPNLIIMGISFRLAEKRLKFKVNTLSIFSCKVNFYSWIFLLWLFTLFCGLIRERRENFSVLFSHATFFVSD